MRARTSRLNWKRGPACWRRRPPGYPRPTGPGSPPPWPACGTPAFPSPVAWQAPSTLSWWTFWPRSPTPPIWPGPAHNRCGSTASGPCSAPGTSSSPAPRAASGAAERALPAVADMGFDVVYLPPDPSHRPHASARARTTPSTPGPTTPAARGPSARRTAGHTALHPELGTFDDFDALVADAHDAGDGDRPRLRPAVLARPPLGHRAPRVVPPPARRLHRLRREPAEEVPGHLPDQLLARADDGDRTALWEACQEILDFWIGHGVRIFRVDNPHTKPMAFWEWLIAEVQRRAPRRALPGRGLHPAQGDGQAGRGRLQPELHLLHLAHRPRPSSSST